ncbi:helix-turn-helix transcriptional regulator [[Phormidium] sp. ETS-05]|uniref:helix-turn-helix transcriptional regulator n=1 Tax=[Phormidium] sp. ETS-05 TaxID=222819 RepID=UPI0018EF28C9|nr:helix-turn-helix transcriptional regulator [[Phormidium] sp. ETS-05]
MAFIPLLFGVQMNNKLLTGTRRELFILIAEQPGITPKQLCGYSWSRGGNIHRINHHLSGLLDEGFIAVTMRKKSPHYQITDSKGQRMLKYLQVPRV